MNNLMGKGTNNGVMLYLICDKVTVTFTNADETNTLLYHITRIHKQHWFKALTDASFITYITYRCPNMINFESVEFSECRSEEVITFF